MIGTHHAKVISELADQIELVAVVNRTLEKAEKITAQRGGTAFPSLTDAMVATDIDVVIICTPPGGRAEVAIEALEAGSPCRLRVCAYRPARQAHLAPDRR